MKTPLTYYGGKQRLLSTILPMIPEHVTYTEVFVGGGAVFWAKPASKVEVINDTNRELINFYEIVQNEYVELEKMIRISLHSRSLYNDATVIYNNPHMFSRAKRAWAVWVLASQSFASKFDGGWGYDRKQRRTSDVVKNKREDFDIDLSIRLQNVQIECTDAIRVIRSRDYAGAFHYCDPPYPGTECGHYDGYSIEDYEALLITLGQLQGKFLLSSYPNKVLSHYTAKNKWSSRKLDQRIQVTAGLGDIRKRKLEVLTANYNLELQK